MKFSIYSQRSLLVCLVVTALLTLMVDATLGPSDKKKKKSTSSKPASSPSPSSGRNDGRSRSKSEAKPFASLIRSDAVPIEDILDYYEGPVETAQLKQFKGNVLGYVTPWNSHGYDVSKQFGAKIDFNSPVWLQIKRNGPLTYELKGTHDIDSGWMSDVRAARLNSTGTSSSSSVRIVPRILFENFEMQDLHALNVENEKQALAAMLVKKAREFKFDGYVLEIYLQLGGHGKTEINHLVIDIAEKLHADGKILILVIPPAIKSMPGLIKPGQEEDDGSHAIFSRDDFDELKVIIDGFSLMTYDFSIHNSAMGANAPLRWVENNVAYFLRNEPEDVCAKLLVGLNFFGMKYHVIDRPSSGTTTLKSQPEAITGPQFIQWIREIEDRGGAVQARFDERTHEHFYLMIVSELERVLVFFPSLYSIRKRIELAENFGAGLSIWELGQGLDYFYDLF